MVLLIAAEIACAELAWHTIGEVVSSLYVILIFFNIIPFLLGFTKFRRLAVGLALLCALLIIPYQVLLGYRWHLLRQETLSIVAHVNQVKKQTGEYPPNLSAYQFLHPRLQHHITYEYYEPTNYSVYFYIGTPDTSHWYNSNSGWGYYPD